jgi:hypothetical protein
MHTIRIILAGALLAACVSMSAQSPANHTASRPAKTKTAKPQQKTQEELLLDQLGEKFQKLDELNRKYDDLQQKYDALQKQTTENSALLEQARRDAAEAKQKLEAEQSAIGPNGAAVTVLKNEVDNLKTASSSLTTQVQATQEATKKLENPESIRFMGVTMKPGGFMAGETVSRQRGLGADINTPFSSIPFTGQTASRLSEFNASGRQSRLSLLVEGKHGDTALRGYVETDFLSAGTTSNNNQSNSYTLRLRQAWAQAELSHHWYLTAGQMWSLATEYRHGLMNNTEATPLTIDAQYNVGFTWARQYGFRAVKQVNSKLWLGASVEEAQTLNIGGHNLPTLLYQQTGNSGGLYSSTSNYSFNSAPDLIAKAAYETPWGHFELFGIGRFFRDRVFPNGAVPTGVSQTTTVSALGAFNSKASGGGVGVNARVSLFSKRVDFGAHVLAGNGMGRYSTTALPDATAHPDGSLELLTGGSALGSVEWHASPRLDFYGYYGGEYAKRAWYTTKYTDTTPGATYGEPILAGYGAPTNPVYGCYVEVLPTSTSSGNVTSSASNCNADTRNFQEGTVGYWYRFYRGPLGTLQQGIQYSYAEKRTWTGIGNPAAGLSNSPKAIENMWFTSFRYYLPVGSSK